jgi:hypothetical protein
MYSRSNIDFLRILFFCSSKFTFWSSNNLLEHFHYQHPAQKMKTWVKKIAIENTQSFNFFKNLTFGTVLCEKEPILSQALF